MSALKFYPFQSVVEPGFWHSLAKSKLEEIKLNEESRDLVGNFTVCHGAHSLASTSININWDALQADKTNETSCNQINISGQLLLLNTIESFKQLNKSQFIQNQGEKIWNKIKSDEFWKDPSVLCTFSTIIFADLKKYQFYYWFNFPSFNLRSDIKLLSSVKVSEQFSSEVLQDLSDKVIEFRKVEPGQVYLLLVLTNSKWETRPLSDAQSLEEIQDESRYFLSYFDPCGSEEHPGWPLRNLVVALASRKPELLNKLEVLSLRVTIKDQRYDVGSSLLMKLSCDNECTTDMPSVVGWEKNDKGQLGPRFVNMKSSMDPVKIAESSVDLNLKLMKWRLVPSLDLDKIAAAKFLLLGSGTLGCGVARSLLGWGARNITFLDNAKVSYSNPVRQSLYEFEDCLEGGKRKSQAAADKLKKIFPGVSSNHAVMTIPMPGHPVSEALEKEAREAHDKLKLLIEDSDVIFLLMDSRESRWLPTVISALYPEKILINAALGFDTYLVMRHGIRIQGNENKTEIDYTSGLITGSNLGCYYCNDVVAPGDSLSDRTLDMQCTVTRPGVSCIAAALAVELAVSCLQHPQGGGAPAVSPSGGNAARDNSESADFESVLGPIPHSIRGSVHTYTQYLPATPAFPQCTACSKPVLDAYREKGFQLVKEVGQNPKFLEDLTGLTNLLADTQIMEGVIDIDDDDFSVSSSM